MSKNSGRTEGNNVISEVDNWLLRGFSFSVCRGWCLASTVFAEVLNGNLIHQRGQALVTLKCTLQFKMRELDFLKETFMVVDHSFNDLNKYN
jgi:hypothetical protein